MRQNGTPPYGSGLTLTNGMLARGIEVFLLRRIFAREGLQIGYRLSKKGCRVQGGAGGKGKRKDETEKGENKDGGMGR